MDSNSGKADSKLDGLLKLSRNVRKYDVQVFDKCSKRNLRVRNMKLLRELKGKRR